MFVLNKIHFHVQNKHYVKNRLHFVNKRYKPYSKFLEKKSQEKFL